MRFKRAREFARGLMENKNIFLPVLLSAVTLMLTMILYPHMAIQQYNYSEGDVARSDIKAPVDFFIEDQEITEANRRKAVEAVRTVYDYDTAILDMLTRNINLAFNDVRAVIEAGNRTDESSVDDSCFMLGFR